MDIIFNDEDRYKKMRELQKMFVVISKESEFLKVKVQYSNLKDEIAFKESEIKENSEKTSKLIDDKRQVREELSGYNQVGFFQKVLKAKTTAGLSEKLVELNKEIDKLNDVERQLVVDIENLKNKLRTLKFDFQNVTIDGVEYHNDEASLDNYFRISGGIIDIEEFEQILNTCKKNGITREQIFRQLMEIKKLNDAQTEYNKKLRASGVSDKPSNVISLEERKKFK